MDKTAAILVALLGEFRADDFYVMSFRDHSIKLQGHFTANILKDIKRFEWSVELLDSGMQVFTFEYKGAKIDITLT